MLYMVTFTINIPQIICQTWILWVIFHLNPTMSLYHTISYYILYLHRMVGFSGPQFHTGTHRFNGTWYLGEHPRHRNSGRFLHTCGGAPGHEIAKLVNITPITMVYR